MYRIVFSVHDPLRDLWPFTLSESNTDKAWTNIQPRLANEGVRNAGLANLSELCVVAEEAHEAKR